MLVTRAIAVLVAGRDDYADGVVDTDDDDSGGGDNDVEADFDSDADGGSQTREVIEKGKEQTSSRGLFVVFEERAIDDQEYCDEEVSVSQFVSSPEIVVNTSFATSKKRKTDSSDRGIKKKRKELYLSSSAEALERVYYQPIIPLLIELVSHKKFLQHLSFQDLDKKPDIYGDILTGKSAKKYLEEMQSYADTTIGAKEHSGEVIRITLLLQRFCDGAILHRSREKKSLIALFITIFYLPSFVRSLSGVGIHLISAYLTLRWTGLSRKVSWMN